MLCQQNRQVFLWYTLMPVSSLQCYLDLLLTQYLIVELNMNIDKYWDGNAVCNVCSNRASLTEERSRKATESFYSAINKVDIWMDSQTSGHQVFVGPIKIFDRQSSALPASSLIMPRTYLQSALHVQRSSKTSLNAAGCEIFEQCLPWRPSLIYFCNTQCCWNQNTIQSTTLCSNQWENAVGIVLALGGSGNSACHFSQESQPSRHSGNRFHLPGWETNL